MFGGTTVWAQEEQNEDSIHIEKPKNFHLYIAPGYALNQFSETNASFLGAHLGIAYKNKIDFNIYYSAILDSFRKQIIFPSTHVYKQKNLGINGQYAFLKNRIKPHAGIGFQYSAISWLPENEGDEEFSDYIYQFKPYIGLSWQVINAFTLLFDLGYLIAPEVELIGLTSEDFDGLSFNFMIKIRFYRL